MIRRWITQSRLWWERHSPTKQQGTKSALLLTYGVALAAVLIAWAGTAFLLHIEVLYTSRFLFFIAAVLVASWYGGLGPGLFAIALSIGMIDIFFFPPFRVLEFRGDEALLLSIFAVLAATISWFVDQRKRLYIAERQARQTLQGRVRLQAIIAELGQEALINTDLTALMDKAATLLAQVLEVEYATILELHEEENHLLLKAGVGWREGVVGQATVSAGRESQAGYTLVSSGPVLVKNLRRETRFRGSPLLIEHGVVSGMSVIISGRQKPYGVFGIHTTRERTFTQDDVYFLQSVANIIAAAVERDRLHTQAQAVAVLEERQRLARELHDSVSQSMFVATSRAEIIPRLWEQDPQKAMQQLQEVITINRGAMAEMRALLLELRPEAVLNNTLPALYQQLVDAAPARAEIAGALIVEGDPQELPPEVHIALYRMVQESVNNILKHSQASKFRIELTYTDEVKITVVDDGQGFDVHDTHGGIGLNSMRERAESIGAALELTSGRGQGTTLIVRWPHT